MTSERSTEEATSEKKKRSKRKKKKRRNSTPVSPSVSHPRNKSRLPALVDKNRSSESKVVDSKVLPLLLEHVEKHTDTQQFSTDKEFTVAAFLQTVTGQKFLINNEPEIVPIPTPVPGSKEKMQHNEEDVEMYTETTSVQGKQTKLLKSKLGNQENRVKPFEALDSVALQQKFESLASNFGRDKTKLPFEEEFKLWCQDHSYWDIRKTEQFSSRASRVIPQLGKSKIISKESKQRSGSEVKIDGARQEKSSSDQTADTSLQLKPKKSTKVEKRERLEVEPAPTFTDSGNYTMSLPRSQENSSRSVGIENYHAQKIETTILQQGAKQPQPLDVSKTTSRAISARVSEPIKKPVSSDKLMLDSYTQTHDADRLSTAPITASIRSTAAQADLDESRKERLTAPSIERISEIDSNLDSLVLDNHKSVRHKSLSLSVGTETMENAPLRMYSDDHFTRNHIHGKSSDVDSFKKTKPRQHARTDQQLIQSYEETEKLSDEGQDSGRDSLTSPVPISTLKLTKIKDLAKSKLNKIKQERYRGLRPQDKAGKVKTTLNWYSEDSSLVNTPSSVKDNKAPSAGVLSVTLDKLPGLSRTELSESVTRRAGLEDERYERSPRKNRTLEEQLHRSKVERAKQYIRKSILESEGSTDLAISSGKDFQDYGGYSLPHIYDRRRSESELNRSRHSRGIFDDVESRKCVSEVPSGKFHTFDVNYKAYVNALERIVDSNLNSLVYSGNHSHSNKP